MDLYPSLRAEMKRRIESELAKQKRPGDDDPDVDALVAVSIGYLKYRTAPGFGFLDDLIGKVIDINAQVGAALVDCYLNGDRPSFTHDMYREQLRLVAADTLKNRNRDAGDLALDTLASLALGKWNEDTDLRAARSVIAARFAAYYAWGCE